MPTLTATRTLKASMLHANGTQQQQSRRFVGLGDPVVDHVVKVQQEQLNSLGVTTAGCIAIAASDMGDLQQQLAEAGCTGSQHPGGSAANVCRGLAQLQQADSAAQAEQHQEVCFVGMVGEDKAGRDYAAQLRQHHVQALLVLGDAPTACCLCMVTPDGERTMRTCLGAATQLRSAEQLPAGWDAGLCHLHCEGYALHRPALAAEAMRAAKRAGAQVSLDLASHELVQCCFQPLQALLAAGLVDIVFCNAREAAALAEAARISSPGQENDALAAAQRWLLQHVQVAVVSRGAAGCQAAAADGRSAAARAPKADVVDSVGAGDAFASGFLWAWCSGKSLQACCQCGCLAGSQAVRTAGAEVSPEQWAAVIRAASDPPAARALTPLSCSLP